MITTGHIALFQYEFPLQVHTVTLAEKLAENGYRVDLFLMRCFSDFIGIETLGTHELITVYDLTPGFKQRIKRKIGRLMGRGGGSPVDNSIISTCVEQESLRLLGDKQYNCFIGIEKKGLIWAGRLAQELQVPYLYYSLELYLEDHPAFLGDNVFDMVRKEEIRYHKGSKATIIQDRMRGDALLKSNGIASTDLLYLPVSLAEAENRHKSFWLHEHNTIPLDKKIILYFGLIDKDRLCFELAEQSGRLGENCTMVFHGQASKADIRVLQTRRALVLSLNLIGQKAIKALISSAAIGLVMYGDTCCNDRLTAFSSEKLALYLQSGIPIIAFDRGNYRELMDAYRCGELIRNMYELPEAVETILNNYENYRAEAFSAYCDLYRYDKYFMTIQAYLSAL